MRVWHVHVSPRLAPVNGVVQSIDRLAAAQRQLGLDVRVFHGTDVDPRREPAVGRVSVLARQIREAKGEDGAPDVVHLHEPFHPPHLAVRALLRDVPWVVTLHGALAAPSLRRARVRKLAYGAAFERAALGRAGGVIALSEGEAARARSYAWRSPRVRLVPNAADPELLADPGWDGGTSAGGRLIYLGRWDVRHKGLDRLAALAARAPEVDVRIHGLPCGNEPEQLALLRATAPGNVAFLAPVTGTAKRDALVAADAFVLLSRWEGQAMALLEAMALGVPCLVSAEVAETLDAPDALAVLPASPDRASVEVRRLLDDRDALAALGRRARRWAAHTATPARVAAATLDAYLDARPDRRAGDRPSGLRR